MHDIRLIRNDPKSFDAALERRGVAPVAGEILALDEEKRAISTRMQEAQNRRNEASKAIGQAMANGDKDTAEALKTEVAEIKQALPGLEEQDRELSRKLDDLLATIPNLPAEDVPLGEAENDNQQASRWGDPRNFDFDPKEHADLGPALGLERGGAREKGMDVPAGEIVEGQQVFFHGREPRGGAGRARIRTARPRRRVRTPGS